MLIQLLGFIIGCLIGRILVAYILKPKEKKNTPAVLPCPPHAWDRQETGGLVCTKCKSTF